MNPIFFPLLASLISSGDIIFEKFIFDGKKSKYKMYVPLMFSFAFIFLMIFFYPFWGAIKEGAFEPIFIIMMIAVVAMGSIRNMLYYYSFQKEGLTEIEPFMAFVPLLTIIIASVAYSSERANPIVLILAIIAALSLIFAHVEKKHFRCDGAMLPILFVVLLEAIENNLAKELLNFYSPVAMYALRSGMIALTLTIFIRPNFMGLEKKEVKNLLMVSFFWLLAMIFTYYGYQRVGVVYTSLILMANPVLIVLGSRLILKEKKVNKKNVFALVVVLACATIAQFIE